MPRARLELPTPHSDQIKAYTLTQDRRGGEWDANAGGRFKAIRCGRRWGKSLLGEIVACEGAIQGQAVGWFAPDYKKLSEVYEDIQALLEPLKRRFNKTEGVLRCISGGRVDFWTLEDANAGRSRKYHKVIIDEGAFTKPNMMDIWKKSILPTLFDYTGSAIVASNTNGVDPENFLYQICTQPEHGFIEYHAPTINNPTIPALMLGETEESRVARRHEEIARLRAREHPLVFRQEYEAEFVDWSGVAFFDVEKWLQGDPPGPIDYPTHCDYVFAVIDCAVKSGKEHDGTAVVYFARSKYAGAPLTVLDWDVVQIEGALLETWLPTVLENAESLARTCGARGGSIGAYIEDKSAGEILLQQARRRSLPAHPIESRLTALGKDERAISVSGYHHRGECKMSRAAYDKVCAFKGVTRNHLVSQVTSFRIGDPLASKRADDLADCYMYGLAVALGDSEGY